MIPDSEWRPEWKPRKPKKTGPNGWAKRAKEEVRADQPRKPGTWQPGRSGNPSGATHEIFDATWTLKRMAVTKRVKFFDKMVELADCPDPSVALRACELLAHYSDGKPMGNLTVRTITSFADLSEEELRALAGLAPGESVPLIEGELAEEAGDSAGDETE